MRASVHRHTDVGLCEGRGVVGAVTGHRHQFAFRLLPLDQRHLVFGSGFREKVVDTGLTRDSRCSQRIVAGDHHGANAHGAQVIEALAHAALHDVGERDHP